VEGRRENGREGRPVRGKKIKRGSHEWELVWSMRFRDNWCGKIGVVLENFDDWT
jgi:hypothetical protein